jgi:hypothetical protein
MNIDEFFKKRGKFYFKNVAGFLFLTNGYDVFWIVNGRIPYPNKSVRSVIRQGKKIELTKDELEYYKNWAPRG